MSRRKVAAWLWLGFAPGTAAGQMPKGVHSDTQTRGMELNALAMQKLENGNLREAERLSREALDLIASESGERKSNDPADAAVAVGNLAAVLSAEGRYIEADRLLRTALAATRRKLGKGSSPLAALLATRAELLVRQGRPRQAIAVLQQEIKIRERRPDDREPWARSCQNLAVAELAAGQYGRAERWLERSEELWTGGLPDDHPLKLAGLNARLVLYEHRRQFERADRLLPVILGAAERRYRDRPSELALVLNNLGTVYADRGEYRQAAETLERACHIDLRVLGEFHPQTAAARLNCGMALQKIGRVEEGVSLETRAKAALSLRH